MRTKHQLLLYSFLFFLTFNYMFVDSIFSQGIDRGDPTFPEEPIPHADYWQEGYDYGFKLGKYYATSGQKETIIAYVGTDAKGKMQFTTIKRIMPLKDYYDAMGNAFYQAKIKNSGDFNMIRYYDGAINGLYDGFHLNIGGSGGSGGSHKPPKDTGDMTENPHEP